MWAPANLGEDVQGAGPAFRADLRYYPFLRLPTSMLFRRPPPPARYELVTRSGCHLCDEMAAVLDEVLPGFGLTFSLRDVDAEPELAARFSDVVPVLLRDGRPVAKVRLTRRTLERIVRAQRLEHRGP
jgi:hypothetical protein